jgi:transposase
MFFDELSNDEWALLAALVSDEPAVRLNRRGRPRAEPRIVANAVLWILTTGEPWSKLPGRYPSGPTCRRRFEEWQLNGTLTEMVRLLSQTGRSFVYIPQASPPAAAKPAPKPAVQPEAVNGRDDGLRGVSWKSPESWQTPAGLTHGWRSLDPLADMTRQLSGALPHDAMRTEPAVSRADQVAAVRGAMARHHDHPRRPLPMSFAVRGTEVLDRRGYVIYVAAESVPNAMYRAWAEIELDGRRVERSGLVGPRFAEADAAQEYALEWARQWIERQGRAFSATVNSTASGATGGAASGLANGVARNGSANGVANGVASAPANGTGYARPLQSVRTMPSVATVTSAGVHIDGPAIGPMSGSRSGQASEQISGQLAAQMSAQITSHHLPNHLSSPFASPLHGSIGALRAPLRRYPNEASVDSTAERFPGAHELVSHAG